jgi:galactokinase
VDYERRKAEIRQAFQVRFGDEPALWVRAPGRVDLMGSHTDYNQGHVLTLSIDRDTWIAARPRPGPHINITSLNLDQSCRFEASDPLKKRSQGWGIYVQGVAHVLREEGFPIRGLDAVVHGTVPISSGLSSSASLEAAAATLFEQLGGFEIEPVRKAKLCQRAENEVVEVNCGILDQYSVILGQRDAAMLLDCRHLLHQYARFPQDLRLVICNTCAPRRLANSAYSDRRAACEQAARVLATYDSRVKALRDVSLKLFEDHQHALDPTVAKRCRFIIEENERVRELAAALSQSDRGAIGVLTAASFAGARDLFEISIPPMLSMIDAMLSAPGAIGARQAGAGFGGCMVAFVEAGHVEDFVAATGHSYAEAAGIAPEIYPVYAAVGAGLLL